MITIKCCKCGHTIGYLNKDIKQDEGISHGYCKPCSAKLVLDDIYELDKTDKDYSIKVLEIIEEAKRMMSEDEPQGC